MCLPERCNIYNRLNLEHWNNAEPVSSATSRTTKQSPNKCAKVPPPLVKPEDYYPQMLLSWCLMSSDVIWHIRDKLWPMPKHGSIRKVYACLAVTCHLHFWQNDRDFLRATVVTRGWNGYRNKSQHRKSTLEKKILPPFQQGFEPATFQSRVRRSNHWAIPAPNYPQSIKLYRCMSVAALIVASSWAHYW